MGGEVFSGDALNSSPQFSWMKPMAEQILGGCRRASLASCAYSMPVNFKKQTLKKIRHLKTSRGLGRGPVVESLPSVHQALGSIPAWPHPKKPNVF